jgi:Ca2+-binding RTX toxin-like protein
VGTGNDRLFGDAAASSAIGGNDTIHGGAGNDLIAAESGVIDGGAGNDTLVLLFPVEDYNFTLNKGVYTITYTLPGGATGTSTVTNVENIDFNSTGQTIHLSDLVTNTSHLDSIL